MAFSQFIFELLKRSLRPGALPTFLLLVSAGTFWLWKRPHDKGPRRFFVTLAAFYWFIGMPIGATLLVLGLSHGYARMEGADEAKGATAIVVLGGGADTYTVAGRTVGQLTVTSALRALEAARIYRLLGTPLVVAAGGIPLISNQVKPESELLSNVLVQAGVDPSRIVLESASTNTREEAQALKRLLAPRGIRTFVLVTSPTHIRRATNTFRAAGLDPIPSPSPLRSDDMPAPWLFVPSSYGLFVSDMALYDYLANLYYWQRGWLDPPQ